MFTGILFVSGATGPIARQTSADSQLEYDVRVRRGSKRLFTVLNYGQTPIEECPQAQLSPTASLDTRSPLIAVTPACLRQSSSHTPDDRADCIIELDTDNGHDATQEINARVTFIPNVQAQKKHVCFDNGLLPDKRDPPTLNSFQKSLPIREFIKRGRIFAKRKQKRLVFKSGEVNFTNTNVHKKSLSYLIDTFTTLLDLKWRYIVILFVTAFLSSWLSFALIWWSFVLAADSSHSGETYTGTSCLDGVDDFSSALLFSLETQQTIGYGTRSVTPACPLAITLVMLQSLIGVILSCLLAGVVFAKFSRPKRRAGTIIFSKCAVICERNGERCLVFRVGDMRRTHLVGVTISAVLIQPSQTSEGEDLPFQQNNLHVQTEAEEFFFLAWPIKIIHKINQQSPLWRLSAEMLLAADFEIVVVLEGTNQTTGQATQIRTSYLPGEILWGHRLNSLITSLKDNNRYQVDYTSFHDTVPIIMGEHSAQTLEVERRAPDWRSVIAVSTSSP